MKKTMGQRYFTIINATLLIIASVLALYPILYVLFASFSDPAMFAKHTGLLFKPEGFSLEAYKAVFEKQEIFTGYKNTIIYLVAGTFINLLFTVSLAYVLSRPYLYWQKFMMVFVVFTMYFNGGLVPTYLLVQNLGLADTRWAILLPTAINTFNLILMRNGFMGIPVSLEEAAKIDGASPLQSLVKIILPLSMPTIAVVVLYYGVAHWNSWFQAMIYLRDQELYPLQLFLRDILLNKDTTSTDMVVNAAGGSQDALFEVVKHSTIIVSTVPILVLYPFLQKYFVQGVMIGAVKG